MEVTGRTEGTPWGRGMPLRPKNPNAKHEAFQKRAKKCKGHPMKVGRCVQKVGQNGEIKFVRRICVLCGTEGTSYECSLCHQSFCFHTDRGKQIKNALKNNKEEVLAKAPGLSTLPPGSQPARWCRVGEKKKGSGEYKFALQACFHHYHGDYLTAKANMNSESDDDAGDGDRDGSGDESDGNDGFWDNFSHQQPVRSPHAGSQGV